ncbi:MAG: hypothetical protein ACRDJ4_05725 [Actinomycetota bacterium]
MVRKDREEWIRTSPDAYHERRRRFAILTIIVFLVPLVLQLGRLLVEVILPG